MSDHESTVGVSASDMNGPNKNSSSDPEAYHSFWAIEPRIGEDGAPDINFKVLKSGSPHSQRELKNQAERVLSIIKILYSHPENKVKLHEEVTKLIALCQVGLVGKDASPEVGHDALRSLEADILEREEGRIKNRYMRKLGAWAAFFSVIGVSLYFSYNHIICLPFDEIYRYRNVFLVWSGAMVGAWASFASRKVRLTFSDLVAVEEDRIEPPMRLIFTGVLTVILSLVFVTGLADIQVGEFRASGLVSSGTVALLLGAFAGLAEKALPSTVMSRANSVISVQKDN